MRDSLLALFVIGQVLVGSFCCGQSTFHFSNLNPPGLNAPIFDAAGNPLSGTNYVAILYGGATIDSLTLATLPHGYAQPMPPVGFALPVAGYFDLPGWVGIATVPPGSYAWLQVRVWDTRLGSTYEDVVALGVGGYGASSQFRALGGDPFLAPPIPPGYLYGLESFSLVPEPSTLALLMFGGAFYWFLRRRKWRA